MTSYGVAKAVKAIIPTIVQPHQRMNEERGSISRFESFSYLRICTSSDALTFKTPVLLDLGEDCILEPGHFARSFNFTAAVETRFNLSLVLVRNDLAFSNTTESRSVDDNHACDSNPWQAGELWSTSTRP
eukprot:CAMPEP_0196589750 /NCGR_PEP_ID=MMETSP1081-20130531/64483_1 /TAXON_ID=36882 /ORGANISM="Pyramimonas amylifera, Strain CCMP720" /LENGTH=129 /DNA_ID=CAMNT_0041912637 /DNA_START=66 /DNA_END=452 /DNA_ORIENTATION=-